MTVTLDLTREEETRLVAVAQEQGTAPVEVLRTLMQQHLPPLRETPRPNEKALATLRDIAALKAGMAETDGSQTDQMLREARAGILSSLPEAMGGDRPFYQTATPEEWSRAWREWAASHSPNTPVLSEEAVSRDSIYEGRG